MHQNLVLDYYLISVNRNMAYETFFGNKVIWKKITKTPQKIKFHFCLWVQSLVMNIIMKIKGSGTSYHSLFRLPNKFHVWSYGRFIEIQSNLRKKKLYRTNQGSNFLGSRFSNRDNVRAQSNLGKKVNPSILKDNFSSRTNPLHQ